MPRLLLPAGGRDGSSKREPQQGQGPQLADPLCILCIESFPLPGGQLCATGKHFFCYPCLELYFRTSIATDCPAPPTCCDRPLPVDPHTLPKDVYAYFDAIARRWETVGDTRCANVYCQALNPRPAELRPQRISFDCSRCGMATCYFCGNLSHLGICASVPDSGFPNPRPQPETRTPACAGVRDTCGHTRWAKGLIDSTDLPFRCDTCGSNVAYWKSFWRCRGRLCGIKECPPCATRRRRDRKTSSRPPLPVQPTADCQPGSSFYLPIPAVGPDPLTMPLNSAPVVQSGQDPQSSPSQSLSDSAAAIARDFPGANLSAGQLARLNKIIERRAMIEVYRAAIRRLEGRPRDTEGQQGARDRYAALQIYSEWLDLEGNRDADGRPILGAQLTKSDSRGTGSQQEVKDPQNTPSPVETEPKCKTPDPEEDALNTQFPEGI
ncbi:uncharacterized protein B0H64DRAFT_61315 [Chaetomium fimeti]|uniref:RING-type domain-containing protein n=1 Tax=Chaetomium fimeti TaxID=1854472 RepID=A0AAE0LLW6_9PEZI|nr:hypothetical protein B0H64DRAFT_61315 [Chaetomium fimeti]